MCAVTYGTYPKMAHEPCKTTAFPDSGQEIYDLHKVINPITILASFPCSLLFLSWDPGSPVQAFSFDLLFSFI